MPARANDDGECSTDKGEQPDRSDNAADKAVRDQHGDFSVADADGDDGQSNPSAAAIVAIRSGNDGQPSPSAADVGRVVAQQPAAAAAAMSGAAAVAATASIGVQADVSPNTAFYGGGAANAAVVGADVAISDDGAAGNDERGSERADSSESRLSSISPGSVSSSSATSTDGPIYFEAPRGGRRAGANGYEAVGGGTQRNEHTHRSVRMVPRNERHPVDSSSSSESGDERRDPSQRVPPFRHRNFVRQFLATRGARTVPEPVYAGGGDGTVRPSFADLLRAASEAYTRGSTSDSD